MVRRIWRPGAVGQAALGAAAIGAVVALGSCGSQVAAGQPAPAGGPRATSMPGVALCMNIPHLTSVVVSQTAALRAFEPGQVLPRGFTIGETHAVRGLAAALCGLPAMPRGTVNCPAQFRGSLLFVFAAGGRPFRPVTVQVSGCRIVTGLGPARSARSAAFWRTLGKDLSLRVPLTSQSGGINP